MPRLPRALVFAVLAWATVLVAYYPVQLDDHWWHMLTGRWILEHGTVPTTDPFSYSMKGAPWVNWEWPAGVVMYSAYSSMGPFGLFILRLAAVLGTLAVVWRHLDVVEGRSPEPPSLPIRLLLSMLLLTVMFGRVGDRPHLYALPFVAAAHLLATRAVERGGLRYLVAQLVLMVPWALFHPSWVLGVIVHTAVLADGWLDERAGRAPEDRPRLGWPAKLSPLVLVLPALATHPIRQYVDAVVGYLTAMRSTAATVSPREWRPMWEFLHWSNTPLVACVLLMLLCVAALFLDRSQLRRPSRWMTLGLLVAGWQFVRFTPEFAVLVVPQIHASLVARWGRAPVPARTAYLAAGLIGAVSLFVLVLTKDIYMRPYSLDVDARQNPVRVADFMERHHLTGNVMSSELNGDAYLAFRLYPDVHEYIDGRIPQLFPESMYVAQREALADATKLGPLLDESGTEHVALQGVFSEQTTAASFVLAQRRDFELVHIDHDGLLWSRKTVLDAMPERPTTFRYVIPPLIDDPWFVRSLEPKRFVKVVAELRYLLAEEPGLELGVALVQTLAGNPKATPEQRDELAKILGGG